MLPWGIKVCILEPGSFSTNICAPDMFERQLREGWNKLTDELKDEYGEEYLDRSMNIYTFHTFISYILTENQRRKLCKAKTLISTQKIFRPYFHYCLSSAHYCEDHFHSHLYPQFKYMTFIYS